MNQPTLFDQDICANNHGGNPQSVEAFRKLMPALRTIRERVLWYAVKERGTITLHGVMQDLKLSHPTASARLTELTALGFITRTGKRRNGCSIYRATEQGNSEVVRLSG